MWISFWFSPYFVTQLISLQNINSYKTGQCYPAAYQNDSFHKLFFEEKDTSQAARAQAIEGIGKVVRVLAFGDSEDHVEAPGPFSSRAPLGSAQPFPVRQGEKSVTQPVHTQPRTE